MAQLATTHLVATLACLGQLQANPHGAQLTATSPFFHHTIRHRLDLLWSQPLRKDKERMGSSCTPAPIG